MAPLPPEPKMLGTSRLNVVASASDNEIYSIAEGFSDQIKSVRGEIAAAHASGREAIGALRDLMERSFDERDRAVSVAADEREKAASALRRALEATILTGDERLREHVTMQIAQVRDALASADALELARIAAVAAQVDSVHEQLTIVFDSSERAIKKAEISVDKRLEGMNDLRSQIERERGSYATKSDLSALSAKHDTAFRPVDAFITETRTRLVTLGEAKNESRAGIGTIGVVVGIATGILALLILLSNGVFNRGQVSPAPTTVTVQTPP